MKYVYPMIAGSLAVLVLSVSPATAGDPAKKMGASGESGASTRDSTTSPSASPSTGSSDTSVDTKTKIDGSAEVGGQGDTPSASPRTGEVGENNGKARGQDPDKKTGLDRADQAAGDQGQQGRDNAREQQEEKKQ
jgi:hypothetical protein